MRTLWLDKTNNRWVRCETQDRRRKGTTHTRKKEKQVEGSQVPKQGYIVAELNGND